MKGKTYSQKNRNLGGQPMRFITLTGSVNAKYALMMAGISTSFITTPRHICSVLYKLFKRPVPKCTRELCKEHIIVLTPRAQQILEDLKQRLQLDREVLIGELSAQEAQTRSGHLHDRSVSLEDPAVISMDQAALLKTFDRSNRDHLTYRLRLLLSLAQIKEQYNPKRADLLFCAVVTGTIGISTLAHRTTSILMGWTLGQWTGNFCAEALQNKGLQAVYSAAARAMNETELRQILSSYPTKSPILQETRPWWQWMTLPYDRPLTKRGIPKAIIERQLSVCSGFSKDTTRAKPKNLEDQAAAIPKIPIDSEWNLIDSTLSHEATNSAP